MSAPTLLVLETSRALRLLRPGRLRPWLGSALRGLAARRFKARVCAFSPEIQDGARKYCRGCPYIAECPYGRTVEPDPPAGTHVPLGLADAARPLVIAAGFPVALDGVVGGEVPVRVLFIGRTAANHADEFWSALAESGRDPEAGLGSDHVTFEVTLPEPPDAGAEWHRVELPTDPTADLGPPVRVRVEMTGPLVLMTDRGDGKRPELHPTFADLFRAGLRTLGTLFRLYGTPLPDEAFRALKDLSAEVPTLHADYQTFRQTKSSSRSGDRIEIEGVVGKAVFGPVPIVLVPWLRWAGRLHVGTHRVAGAGGWQVCLEDEG